MTHSTFKKNYFVFVGSLVALFSLCVFAVHAQEGTSTASDTDERHGMMEGRIEERREALQENMQERRADVASTTTEFKERVATHRAELAKKLQDRVYNLLSNITGRMNAAVFRLSNIADRIDSRAGKLEGQGVNVGATRAALAKARVSLAAARTILTSDLGSFVQQDKPRERFGEVRGKLTEAYGHIRDARTSLVAAFTALKNAMYEAGIDGGIQADTENGATTTSATSTNQQ